MLPRKIFTILNICLVFQAIVWGEYSLNSQHILPADLYLPDNTFQVSPKIKKLLKKAYNGDADAQATLGMMYFWGTKELPQNDDLAKAWLEQSANNKNPIGQLGLNLFYNKIFDKESPQTIQWYAKAAQYGNSQAQYILGFLYDNGHASIVENDALAMHWYGKAANQGNTKAQYRLSNMYFKGEGTKPNWQLAVKWCRKAAKGGNPEAQYILGALYATGYGLNTDYIQAYKWSALAAEKQGSGSSAQALVYQLARMMTPEEIKKANLAKAIFIAKE